MSVLTTFLTPELHQYLLQVSLREVPLLAELRKETMCSFSSYNMQTAPEQAQFLALLIKLNGVRHVIDIGTFTGYSALSMAMALPMNGKVITCDIDEEATIFAKQYWKKAGLDNKIDLRLAPAKETFSALIRLHQKCELIYIDADKINLYLYYEQALKLLPPSGLMAIDNVLWGGRVIDKSNHDESTQAIRTFNQKIHEDERVDISLIPIGDGLTLARKK